MITLTLSQIAVFRCKSSDSIWVGIKCKGNYSGMLSGFMVVRGNLSNTDYEDIEAKKKEYDEREFKKTVKYSKIAEEEKS